jgi:hypothetical protein
LFRNTIIITLHTTHTEAFTPLSKTLANIS